MDDSDKNKIKALFSDWNGIVDERKELNKDINKVLRNNEEYLKLVQQKKELLEEIKAKQVDVTGALLDEKENMNNNLRVIVSDVQEALGLNSAMVNTLFRFYKKRHDHGIDELDMIVMNYLEIFQGEDE
jgi:uncharacterized protein (UPF0335 family)